MGRKLPIKWDNSKYNTGEIVKEATINIVEIIL